MRWGGIGVTLDSNIAKREKTNKLLKLIWFCWLTVENTLSFCWTFQMQIFRSIDSNSVKRFPKDPKDATSKVKNIYLDVKLLCYSKGSIYVCGCDWCCLYRTWYAGRMF